MITKLKKRYFGNLEVTKTRIEDKSGIEKQFEVMRREGDVCIMLGQSDPDYKKAMILTLNLENEKAF